VKDFIIYALKGRTTPDFALDNLAELGRMDLVCEVVANALFFSNGIRKDTRVYVCLTGPRDPPKLIIFDGETLRGMDPDTPTVAKTIKDALKGGLKLQLNEQKEVQPGATIAKKAFEPLVKEKAKTSQLVYLDPEGEDIRSFEYPENVTFVLGDFIGLPRNTEKLLDRFGAKRINLGPKVLFAAHCPILVHNEMDRRESKE